MEHSDQNSVNSDENNDLQSVNSSSSSSSAADGAARNNNNNGEEPQEITVIPVPQQANGWVDSAVLSIATACNLCDTYVHDQVRFEWDNENSDVELDSASFDLDMDKKVQIEVYKKFLFDETSIRIEDDEDDNEDLVAAAAAVASS